jgi:RNA polymerase sigma-70 factor (ECF subfamily)
VAEQTADARRFEELFRSNYAEVLAYALRRTDPETAEEVVADAFLVCWRRLEDVPVDPLPWLLGVARRCLANRRRGAVRRSALLDRLGARVERPIGNEFEGVGNERSLAAAFAGLSEVDRETLRLIAWERLPVKDAARAAGCSVAAFAVRLHRARRRLAANLSNPAKTGEREEKLARRPTDADCSGRSVSARGDSDDPALPETAT